MVEKPSFVLRSVTEPVDVPEISKMPLSVLMADAPACGPSATSTLTPVSGRNAESSTTPRRCVAAVVAIDTGVGAVGAELRGRTASTHAEGDAEREYDSPGPNCRDGCLSAGEHDGKTRHFTRSC